MVTLVLWRLLTAVVVMLVEITVDDHDINNTKRLPVVMVTAMYVGDELMA